MYRYYYFNNNGQDDYGFKGVDDCGNAWKCNKYKFEFPMQSQDVIQLLFLETEYQYLIIQNIKVHLN